MNKKKILFFQHASVIGGASWCLLEIIQELDLNRYTPVVVLKMDGALKTALEEIGVTVRILPEFPQISCAYPAYRSLFRLSAWREFLSLRKKLTVIHQVCLEESPDIVYLNSSTYFPIAKAAKKAGVHLVILHIREHFNLSRLDFRWHFWRSVVSQSVDKIFSISHSGSIASGFSTRTTVVRDWPDFTSRGDEIEVDIHEKYQLPRNKRIILVPGGNSPGKGTIFAIKAFEKINFDTAIMVILGTAHIPRGGVKGLIRSVLSFFGIRPTWLKIQRIGAKVRGVYLLPKVHCMKQFFEMAEVVVSPFVVPHCAKTALEAALFCKPSILSDFGESREYVIHGKTGFITASRDISELTSKIELLLENPDECAALGKNARSYVSQEFDMAENMRKIVEALV